MTVSVYKQRSSRFSRWWLYTLVSIPFLIFFPIGTSYLAEGQVSTSITPTIGQGNLGTTVSPEAGNIYNITGGTRAGTNLFHSFGNFSVGAADTANFLNTPINGTPPLTSNILARVTGGNVSNIFGTIQTVDFGNANLFLMNSAGFIFGPNATMNVAGIVAFTSADYLKLSDSGRFNSNPNTLPTDVLTPAPVVAFGFLGTNPGAITVQGSQFTVNEGTGISFVGGDITIQAGTRGDAGIQPAKLTAHSGQVNLVSVAGTGEVLAATFDPASTIALGSINLSQNTVIDVSGNAGGTVRIRGGSFVMDQSVISADSINANGAPVAVDIKATENVSISTIDRPAITATSMDTGSGGNVRITSRNIDVTGTAMDNPLFAIIDTHTSGTGTAGNVSMTTGDLSVTGISVGGLPLFIDTGTIGPNGGHGGNINITAHAFSAADTGINSGNTVAIQVGEESTGSAGNISIAADTLQFTNVAVVADAFSSLRNNTGRSGNISLNTTDMNLDFSFITTMGGERGGSLVVNTSHLVAEGTQLTAQTFLLPGGGITLTGNVIELKNGSTLVSSTGGNGDAGPITITATDRLTLLRTNPTDGQSGIFSNSFGRAGSLGNAGDITITTPRLDITGGARINTSTATSGHGGNVTIGAATLTMSGESSDFQPEPLFALGVTQPSGIFTLSVGGKCSGACGNAGNVSVDTNTLSMGTGSQINSGTGSNGQGGNITINARNAITMSGTLSTGQSGGIQSRSIGTAPDAGSGGNISLTAGQSISVRDGAAISASSTGPGNAGNISINAGRQFDVRNGSITTKADQATGGNIDIRAIDRVRFVNSQISASVGADSGNGGNITIDPNVVALQNSQVLARAVQGHGGNITITTPLFLQDQRSLVDASSQFGVSGTVTIQSPISNLSGTVKQLPSKPSETQALLQNRCAALAGGDQSTFILAGRDALPSEPGGWLNSPMAVQTGTGHGHEGLSRLIERNMGLRESSATITQVAKGEVLSLRRLTPPGFLVRSFAVAGPTGCHS